MITFSRFGNYGRLGNQLFQYAAMLGFADHLRTRLLLPPWEYAEHFESKFPSGVVAGQLVKVGESKFIHDPNIVNGINVHLNTFAAVDVLGYFQTEKYWEHCRQLVRNTLTFKKELLDQLRRKYYKSFEKKVIAIHIRRGDYVGNQNYAQLPITYFISALFKHFPDWRKHNIIVFGDDIGYCKVHFDCMPNVAFAEGNSDIEDLALMSLCNHFIISNSSFSWWGAYLGQKNGTRIVRPVEHFAGALAERSPITDFYPAHWLAHEHERLDLTDVTFTIPVSYDSKDRKKNLELCVCMLQHNFKTNIIIGEQGGYAFQNMQKYCRYIAYESHVFHRTRMLNDMAAESKTPFVANWDADVLVPPLQLWDAVERLRGGAEMVYPYSGMFARIPRLPWFGQIEATVDVGVVGSTKFNGMNNTDDVSFGGAVLFNRSAFFEGGAENENFVSFGPEDVERYFRFQRLGYRIERTLGALYHINHYVGPNSSNRHSNVKRNRAEWEKVSNMGRAELLEYVLSWSWQTTTSQPPPEAKAAGKRKSSV